QCTQPAEIGKYNRGHAIYTSDHSPPGRISLASEECFRLVVTVRAADCGDQQLCGGRGYCVARPDQEAFTCSCCSEWSGPYCEVSDPCSKRPCAEGATCVSDGSDYKCFCAEGTTGSNCSRPSDTCGTCLNGGTCAPDGVTCLCPRGYTGDGCGETAAAGETTPCDPSPCLRGECQVEGDAAVCVCPPGYRGQFCETHDVCSSAPCRYGGTCHPLGDGTGFNCSCATGFRGSVCQFRVLPLCTVHPCSNGGTCWDEGATYYCTCQHGFSGKHCEVPPGLIGHFDIHHMRSGVPIMASLSIGLFLVIAVVGCCYCRSVGGRQSLSRLCRPVSKCRSAARCCPRRTYKQFSEDQRKNLLEMGYSHSHQPIVEPIFADVDCSEAAEMPLIT
ncbi:delta and Notch-like epidermal growth factor-related receptor, partial [Amphibalanus amphitrite]|uniref:delta and Notch-like epidermal growth factor-related receptor n=1 Tax=Amphibalanus amphitrite TaxID=1232801 RepID=UPI001C91A2BF